MEWARAQGPVLVAVGVLHGAAHVGAEIVEGDDIVVEADAVPSVPSELNDEVVVRLKGVCEVDGLALIEGREGGNTLAGVGAGAAADILTKLRLERDWGDMACSA